MQDKDKKKEFNYWRGFRELHNDPDFQKAREDEFEEGVVETAENKGVSAVSRRTFLALMASSAALAATACSDYRDKGAIVPYNKKPEEITVGNPNVYASTCTACPNHCGILIKTREGRPVKIDGNTDHPVNKGKICATGQANILNLYDPSRIKEPMFRTGADNFVPSNWADADKSVIDELKKSAAAGREIAVISHAVTSPSFKYLFDDFVKAYPSAKLYSYELVSGVNKQSAFKKSYGKDGFPVIKWNEAKIILSVECDFLGKEGNFVEAQRLFAESRDVMKIDGEFNRLYTVEGGFSLTGANSDYRIRLKTDAAEEFVYALLSAVESGSPLSEISKKHNIKIEVLNELVKDLKVNRGKAIVTGGAKLPESAHIAINKLNDVLGASALYSADYYNMPVLPLTQKEEWNSLVSKMNSGAVGVVIHFDTNPVY
ncbi:MAG: TAT-variant-translocated molybdopterin oxidoreductase, partial [Ignavibacteria bacterium]|nr:TAT-variant-translocated molybdopterin oxidoreductase [Ignavibacteria bacterium]